MWAPSANSDQFPQTCFRRDALIFRVFESPERLEFFARCETKRRESFDFRAIAVFYRSRKRRV